ncbi:MAG TPA: hypothetical protein VJ962_02645 [Clostridia bacterium]|nr:hypothetical protein [Clostridia bacterium]
MNNRGSLSIEASIGIFVIIIIFAFILSIMNALFINEVVNQGLYKTAVETSSLKGTNYTLYQSNISKTLMINSMKKQLKEDIKYNTYEKLLNSDLEVDYDYHKNEGIIQLNYSFALIGKPIKVNKEITFRSFLHKDLSIRTLDDHKVYITNTGNKYHKDGCFYLKHSKNEIILREAIKNEYTPCSKCYFIGH